MNNAMQQIQQLGSMLKGIKNPQQAVLQMLGNNSNQMAKQVLEMAQKGDYKGIEDFARNVCNEKGANFDEVFSDFKNNLGL